VRYLFANKFLPLMSKLCTEAGPALAQCKTWARGPMQDLGAGPLWAVILWRHRVQSTVLRS